jgi:hypothetical protein
VSILVRDEQPAPVDGGRAAVGGAVRTHESQSPHRDLTRNDRAHDDQLALHVVEDRDR